MLKSELIDIEAIVRLTPNTRNRTVLQNTGIPSFIIRL
jgi:hypothetical protein